MIVIWSATSLNKKNGPLVFILLFILLFLDGGGVGQIIFFTLIWAAATRINNPLTWWRKILSSTLRRVLAKLWPAIDFSELDEIWWGRRIESQASLNERVRRFASAMAATADWRRVAVVSHWGFIRASTGETLGNAELVRWNLDDQEMPEAAPPGPSKLRE